VWNYRTAAVITVPVELAPIDTIGPTTTQFIIKGFSKFGKTLTWVTVRQAFSSTSDILSRLESTIVDRDGRFSLQGRHGGQYILTICQVGKVVATKVMEIPDFPKERIEISIE
jgi:hypothetical protein